MKLGRLRRNIHVLLSSHPVATSPLRNSQRPQSSCNSLDALRRSTPVCRCPNFPPPGTCAVVPPSLTNILATAADADSTSTQQVLYHTAHLSSTYQSSPLPSIPTKTLDFALVPPELGRLSCRHPPPLPLYPTTTCAHYRSWPPSALNG